MKVGSPSKIYTTILDEVNHLIQSLTIETTDDEIRKSQEDAQKQLKGIHREVNCALESLQKNAEWDIFSIAFYGETNAGKSTLIETLRILLNEPSKIKERQRFKQIICSIDDIQKQLEQEKSVLEQIEKSYQQKILNFGKLAEQKECRSVHQEISDYKSDIAALNKENSENENSKNNVQQEWEAKAREAKVSVEQLKERVKQISGQLSECCDGKIIGDGRSDFTREVTTYKVENNGQKFALLDLPGIEGKEDLVLKVINDAVQKAHAIFFINSNPTPPQTGDKGNEGTLEKIKKHFEQQTEVYSIFNKRVKNPLQLKPGIIDDDEKESLKEHDKIMQGILGEQYKNYIVLSAYPAFLAVANCWQNDFGKGQKKFLEKFETSDNLLQKTLVKSFSNWLTTNLVNDCKEKINKSNYKKVSFVLARTINEINEIYKSLHGLEEKLLKNEKATSNQLDEVAEIIKQQFDTEAYKAVDEFKTLLRRNIYKDIDTEINNDEFKSAFERRKKEAIDNLSIVLKQNFDSVMSEFKNEIEDIIEKYYRYASELLSAYSSAAQFDFYFTPNIDIKSGINWTGMITSIVGSIAGVILCLTNPAGWVVLAVSILGAVISIGKAVLGFFNHKYRASQQKKNADDNIEKMGDKVTESVIANLKDARKPLHKGIADIKNELQKSVNHIKMMNQVFSNAKTKFTSLITTVQVEEAH